MKFAMAGVCLFSMSLMAQQPFRGAGGPGPLHQDQLKSVLDLSDDQISQLRQLRFDQHQAARPILEQIGEKERALRDLLAGTPTAASVGQIVLDMEALRSQIRQNAEAYQAQAAAVLTAEQKIRLKSLEEAMKLQPAISQAVGLGLLSGPERMPLHVETPAPRMRTPIPHIN